jgi:hypothetical protein
MTMTDGDLFSLADAVREGLFPSIDAARKASTRDRRFPAPVAKQGATFLYDMGALRAYRAPLLLAAPPDNPPPGPEWLPYPGAGYYEFSHRGKARSVDRMINGKSYAGTELATRLNNQGYVLVDIRLDDGTKKTVTMHSGVLRSHVGEPGPDEETLHGTGGQQDNRWPENIRWGTHPANVAERVAANPRVPKPLKVCPLCQREHNGRGRRCHECVCLIGEKAAAFLVENPDLEAAARKLDYPSAVGVFNLAVKHGALCLYVDQGAVTGSEPSIRHPESPEPWLRRVINRARASRRNSDAR